MLLTGILITVNVVLRQFSLGVSWMEELIRYLIIFLTFIGVSICIKDRAHINIDILGNILKDPLKKIMRIICYIIGIVTGALLAYYSLVYIAELSKAVSLSPTLGIPMHYIYVALFISGVLIFFRYVAEVVKAIRN